MGQAREAIVQQRFPAFLKAFFWRYYKGHANYPWDLFKKVLKMLRWLKCSTQNVGGRRTTFSRSRSHGGRTQARSALSWGCFSVGLCIETL